MYGDGRIMFKTFLLVSPVERTTGKTNLGGRFLPDIVTLTRKVTKRRTFRRFYFLLFTNHAYDSGGPGIVVSP